VEPAEKLRHRQLPLLRVAFPAAGDKVAVGIVLQVGLRDDMVDAARRGGKSPPAIKTVAALSQMDGAAEASVLEEVAFLERLAASGTQRAPGNWTGGCGGNLLGQAHLHHVARSAALHQANRTARDQTAQGPPHSLGRETDTLSEPGNRKPELKLSFQTAVTEKMRIDNAVGRGQAQTRR